MSLEAHGFFSAQTAKPMKITRRRFEAYERVRRSGKTNMFDIDEVVHLSNRVLNRQAVANIIKHYDYLKKKFSSRSPSL